MSVVLKNHFVNDSVVPQCQKFGLAYKDRKEVSTLTGFSLCRISLNKKKKKAGLWDFHAWLYPSTAGTAHADFSAFWFFLFSWNVYILWKVYNLWNSLLSQGPREKENAHSVIPGECFRAVGLDRKPQRRGWRQETWRKEGEPGQRVPGGSG